MAGIAQIAEQEGTRAIALVAEGFPKATKSRFYAIWVYKSQEKARRLGFPPPPDKNGRVATSFAYPEDAKEFDQLIITQESQQRPQQPGKILLAGPLEGTPVDSTSTTPQTPPQTQRRAR
jgi:hypothetical protein